MLKGGDKIDIDNAVLYAGGCPEDFHYHYAYKDSVNDGMVLYVISKLDSKNIFNHKTRYLVRVPEKSLIYVFILFFFKTISSGLHLY